MCSGSGQPVNDSKCLQEFQGLILVAALLIRRWECIQTVLQAAAIPPNWPVSIHQDASAADTSATAPAAANWAAMPPAETAATPPSSSTAPEANRPSAAPPEPTTATTASAIRTPSSICAAVSDAKQKRGSDVKEVSWFNFHQAIVLVSQLKSFPQLFDDQWQGHPSDKQASQSSMQSQEHSCCLLHFEFLATSFVLVNERTLACLLACLLVCCITKSPLSSTSPTRSHESPPSQGMLFAVPRAARRSKMMAMHDFAILVCSLMTGFVLQSC